VSAEADARRFLGSILDAIAHGKLDEQTADLLAGEFVGFCDEWAGVDIWEVFDEVRHESG